MRYVVVGAGAVGGVVAARLAQRGHDVAVVARGAHLDAVRRDGLRVQDPTGTAVVPLVAVAAPAELPMTDGDVVLLAVKSQDTESAVTQLVDAAPTTTPIVCLQNGVANEPAALRFFEHVYGVVVMCPTLYLEPGAVRAYSSPNTALLDIGRYPGGVDVTTQQIAADFTDAVGPSEPRPDVMRWKYRKLVANLHNAIDAVCGRAARGGELAALVDAEAETTLDAAEIDRVSVAEDQARRGELLTWHPVGGESRPGGSSWQSLERGAGSIETDYLNGEIVLLGRTHGVDTPANSVLCRLARELVATGAGPGRVTESDVLALIGSG